MRNLFTIDKKNYIENGTVGTRPSVRGIIVKDGKIAMMHSRKYDYYKLPGGGIEEGETHKDTLIREVREEAGLVVIPESIHEYGYMRRIEKGRYEDIFIQDNFYYFCQVEEDVVEQELDVYEEEEQFVLEYVTVQHVIDTNNHSNHGSKEEVNIFRGMLERENRILQMVQEEFLEME